MSGVDDLPTDRDNYILTASVAHRAGRDETLSELVRALYLLRPEWFESEGQMTWRVGKGEAIEIVCSRSST